MGTFLQGCGDIQFRIVYLGCRHYELIKIIYFLINCFDFAYSALGLKYDLSQFHFWLPIRTGSRGLMWTK